MRRILLPRAVFVALCGLVFLLSLHTLTSIYQDVGRHIALGRIIWETHAVPRTNLFSYTNPDFPFINHHWLGEVLFYLGDRAAGLKGLIALKALLVAGAFALALAAAWRPRSAGPAAVLGLVAAAILSERTDVRPEIFSFLFLGWYLFVLYRKPDSRLFWSLPLVQALWVNTHIYFFIGPFVYLGYLAGVGAARGVREALSRRKILLGGLLAAATLANPWFVTGALYPLSIFRNYGYSVLENQTPFFLKAWGYPQLTTHALFLGMLLAVLGVAANHRNLRANATGLILMLGTAALALIMLRNYPLFALTLLPASLKNFDESGWFCDRTALAGLGLLAAVLGAASIVTGQFFKWGGIIRQFGPVVPAGYEKPLAFFREAKIRGPIFNNFDIGSYLIWRLPEEKVFIDGRPEAYPASFIENVYKRMQDDPIAWRQYSDQYGINAVVWGYNDLTPWSRTFLERLIRDPGWVPVYRERGIAIWVRNPRAAPGPRGLR